MASAALQAALSWWALDALRVAAASAPNRATLVEAGALPALAAVLKAALSRLHSMSAVLRAAPPLRRCASMLQSDVMAVATAQPARSARTWVIASLCRRKP